MSHFADEMRGDRPSGGKNSLAGRLGLASCFRIVSSAIASGVALLLCNCSRYVISISKSLVRAVNDFISKINCTTLNMAALPLFFFISFRPC